MFMQGVQDLELQPIILKAYTPGHRQTKQMCNVLLAAEAAGTQPVGSGSSPGRRV